MNNDLKSRTIETQQNYTFYVATDPHIEHEHKNLDIFNDAFRNENGNVFLNKDVMYVILRELEENSQVVYEDGKFNLR